MTRRGDRRERPLALLLIAALAGVAVFPLLAGVTPGADRLFVLTTLSLPGLLLALGDSRTRRRAGYGLALLLPLGFLLSRVIGEPLLVAFAAIWIVPLAILPVLYAKADRSGE